MSDIVFISPLIVALNFDNQSWIFECREACIAFKTEYDSLKQITDTPLDKPTTEVYDVRADLARSAALLLRRIAQPKSLTP